MDEGAIKESQLIELDGTIENLIGQIKDLNTEYGNAASAIKSSAESIAKALKSISGATNEGRQAIDNSAAAAGRLERAQKELAFSLTETGKQVAWLKAQTTDNNRATVEQQQRLQAAASSYNRIKADVKELTSLYKSLTAAERADANFGEEIIAELRQKNAELKSLDAAIRPAVESMTRLQKAEQELAYWTSEEGQQLLQVRQQIKEVTASKKEQTAVVSPLAEAYKKLEYAQSSSNLQLKEIQAQTKNANALAEAQAKVNVAAAGSYDELAAQFALNMRELRAMGVETEEDRKKFAALQQTVAALRAQMQTFEESTGNYSLNVGNYSSVWTGLGFQVQQVVRELPAAAISLNNLFLAVSNNIPILVDEIKKLKLAGRSAKDILQEVGKSLFSWQSALVVVLAVFSKFGKEIIDWTKNLFTADNAISRLIRVQKNLREEITKTNGSFGSNLVTVRRLKDEFKALRTDTEKSKWVQNHTSDWNKLNVAIYNVADAEKFFDKNTQTIVDAFKNRAKAAAAYKLAEDKYAEMLPELLDLERVRADYARATEPLKDAIEAGREMDAYEVGAWNSIHNQYNKLINERQTNIDKIQAEIDAYYALGKAAEDAAKPVLGEYDKPKTGKGEGRDITKYIENARLQVTKANEEAITKLQTDEYSKRRAEALKNMNVEIGTLRKTYNENARILEGYYKLKRGLTEEQKNILEQMQQDIKTSVLQYEQVYNKEIEDIEYDHWQAINKATREGIQQEIDTYNIGAEDLYKLTLEIIQLEQESAILANQKLEEALRLSTDEIVEHFNRLRELTKGDLLSAKFNISQTTERTNITRDITSGGVPGLQAAFTYGDEGSRKREVFLIDQQILSIENQLDLAKKGQILLDEQQTAELEEQLATLEAQKKEISDFKGVLADVASGGISGGILGALGFDQASIDAFNSVKDQIIQSLNEILEAEIEIAQKELELAQERTEAAKNAVDAEIEARNNGYANSVETARKQLEQEKRNEAEKQKMLEEAQRKQETLNTITQASSLITAAALLWSTMAGIPIVGPVLAATAIAAMFGSFAYAKVKAYQVTASQAYGEGGLEFLEGGSHASGNGIDLHTKNSKNKNMRAEGGEAMAIINKRNTKKYRKELPSIIASLNDGTFQEKYFNAFNIDFERYPVVNSNLNVDLSTIENTVANIYKQGEKKVTVLADGTIVEQCGYNRRTIRKS